MFPSNPFPQLTPSLILTHERFAYERDHHHHHPDLLLQPPAPAIYNNVKETIFTNHLETNFLPRRKLPAKRDRHSKIYTAQGARDRRVRLSIEIARKFFDLQDMLGFDKASLTLDWLLNKSRTAIKDLVQSKLGCTSSSDARCSLSSIYECESDKHKLDQENREIASGIKEKKLRKPADKSSVIDLAARESRAKARARARERTREKMRVRNEMKKFGPNQHGDAPITQLLSGTPVVLNWEIGSNIACVNQSTGTVL